MSIYAACVLLSTALWPRPLDGLTGRKLDATEQQLILQLINNERINVERSRIPGMPKSVDLPTVTWDDSLATTALSEALLEDANGNCVLVHVGNYIEGQAFSWSAAEPLESLFNGWREEKWGYDWATDDCDWTKSPSGCGHWKGLLNAGLDLMGCAIVRDCGNPAPRLTQSKLVCHYGRSPAVSYWSRSDGRPYDCRYSSCALQAYYADYPDCVKVNWEGTTQEFRCFYEDWAWGRPYYKCSRITVGLPEKSIWVFFQGVKWIIGVEGPEHASYQPNGINNAYCYGDTMTPGKCDGKWLGTMWDVVDTGDRSWCVDSGITIDYNARPGWGSSDAFGGPPEVVALPYEWAQPPQVVRSPTAEAPQFAAGVAFAAGALVSAVLIAVCTCKRNGQYNPRTHTQQVKYVGGSEFEVEKDEEDGQVGRPFL